MAFFKDANGKVVEVKEAVDIKEWEAAGLKRAKAPKEDDEQPQARSVGRPPVQKNLGEDL